MLVAVAATAQTPTATLSHEGNVKCFYGKEALVNAVAEADNGDNITLSSGLFSGTTIDKAITLKGAGMSPDTINGITPTTINSDMTINTSDVTVEGIYIAGKIMLGHLNNIKIIKSKINEMSCLSGEGQIYQYFINSICLGQIMLSSVYDLDLFIENSFVHGLCNREYRSRIDARNSIVGTSLLEGVNWWTKNSYFTNCIIIKRTSTTFDNSCFVYYCIGFGSGIFDNVNQSYTNTQLTDFTDLFKTYNGFYVDENETFELTAAAQAAYLGDDGTQIGIYGGNMPFNPKPNNPYITKLTVAEKSTPQGTLSVDIQVQPAQ